MRRSRGRLRDEILDSMNWSTVMRRFWLSSSHGRGEGRLSPRKALPQPWTQNVSPIEWDNVILYGQYVLDRALVR